MRTKRRGILYAGSLVTLFFGLPFWAGWNAGQKAITKGGREWSQPGLVIWYDRDRWRVPMVMERDDSGDHAARVELRLTTR